MDLLDKPNVLECLITVASIVFLFYLPGLFLGKFKDSHDILASLMLHLTEKKWVSVWSWYWIWVALSLVTLVVFPWILGDDSLRSWFVSRHGLLVTLNYILVVPFLLRAYLELLRETGHFFKQGNLDNLGLSFKTKFQPVWRNIISNLILLFVTLLITNFVVSGINSPWKDFSKEYSCLFYSLMRAFDAYLAGGLIFLVLGLLYVFYCRLDHSGIDQFLVDPKAANFELKLSIRRLVKRLSWCLLLGPLVVAIHGWALYWEATLSLANPIARVWMAWTAVMSIGAACLLYGIWKFNSSVKGAVAKKMWNEVEGLWEKEQQSLHSYNAKLEALMNINAYVRSRGRVSDVRESVLIVVLPLLLQLISFIRFFFR